MAMLKMLFLDTEIQLSDNLSSILKYLYNFSILMNSKGKNRMTIYLMSVELERNIT